MRKKEFKTKEINRIWYAVFISSFRCLHWFIIIWRKKNVYVIFVLFLSSLPFFILFPNMLRHLDSVMRAKFIKKIFENVVQTGKNSHSSLCECSILNFKLILNWSKNYNNKKRVVNVFDWIQWRDHWTKLFISSFEDAPLCLVTWWMWCAVELFNTF